MTKWQEKWWENGRVIVKPWKMMEEQYGFTEVGNINCQKTWTYLAEMECPESRIIEVKDGTWRGWHISQDMLLGPAFEWGEMIGVRDCDSDEWLKMPFRGYSCTLNKDYYLVHAGDTLWKQFRPIVEEKKAECPIIERFEIELYSDGRIITRRKK